MRTKKMIVKDLGRKYKIYTEDLETGNEEIWSTLSKKGIKVTGREELDIVSRNIYWDESTDRYFARLGERFYECKGGLD